MFAEEHDSKHMGHNLSYKPGENKSWNTVIRLFLKTCITSLSNQMEGSQGAGKCLHYSDSNLPHTQSVLGFGPSTWQVLSYFQQEGLNAGNKVLRGWLEGLEGLSVRTLQN